MALLNTLPDPNIKITDAGAEGSPSLGTYGPGFASVKFSSNQPTMVSRTNGGRVVTRSQATQYWNIDISYNPLTRAEFEPINSFLMGRQGRLTPFFVILPQYENPQDSDFAAYVASNPSGVTVDGAVDSSATVMTIDGLGSSNGSPKPGDLFTITDSLNSNHVKAYMVTRVETNSDYYTSQPLTTKRHLHFNPPLTYEVSDNSILNFDSPKIRVIQKNNIQEYSLGTNNLFQFSLSLEEALP